MEKDEAFNQSLSKYLELCEQQKYLRDNGIDILIGLEFIGSDDTVYTYTIRYEKGIAKRLCNRMVTVDSLRIGPGSYSGGWDTYEEALYKALEFAKSINL